MRKGFLLIIVLAVFGISDLAAQNVWTTLGKVSYKKIYDDLLGIKVDFPVFNKEIRDLEGKEIKIKGYIIPTDGYKSHKEFVFSAFPYSMCFFCGGAGPETVMEIKAKEGIKYTTEPIEIKGKLKLNTTDVNRLMYLLYDVELVK